MCCCAFHLLTRDLIITLSKALLLPHANLIVVSSQHLCHFKDFFYHVCTCLWPHALFILLIIYTSSHFVETSVSRSSILPQVNSRAFLITCTTAQRLSRATHVVPVIYMPCRQHLRTTPAPTIPLPLPRGLTTTLCILTTHQPCV